MSFPSLAPALCNRLLLALSKWSIPWYQLSDGQLNALLDSSRVKAEKIFASDQTSGRTMQETFDDTYTGSLGEELIRLRLLYFGFEVERNQERDSQEYTWDLKVACDGETAKLEVKIQGAQNDFLSFNKSRKVETLRSCWRSYDAILAWRPDLSGGCLPWLLVDREAISPERDLFVPSQFKGYYLKTEKTISQGLAARLN